MSKNDGKEAEKAWLRLMNAKPNTVIERFWDQSDLRGRNGGRAVGDFPKPADFLVMQHGVMHLAEVKSVLGGVSFPFANIKTKQRTTALSMAKIGAGHLYTFYVFNFELGQWFAFSGDALLRAIENDRASIKFKDMIKW